MCVDKMELIIKATHVCNFACTFCSAAKLQLKKVHCVPNQIVKVIKTLNPDGLIITGGDPLCVDRRYYEDLLSLGEWPISITTNLKAYYLNRSYWKPILSNPRISVATSFQYGNERLWDADTVFDENMFLNVMHAFKNDFNYVPPFIAVITPDNIDRAIDHVYLAKRLGTKVKLNGVVPVGKSTKAVPLYKMIDIWDRVSKLKLQDYVMWDPQFTSGGCNWNTNHMCKSCIRSCWVDQHDQLHYGFCETLLEGVCQHPPVEIPVDNKRPQPIAIVPSIQEYHSHDCLGCELCDLCNGCYVNKEVMQWFPDFCEQMKARKQLILSHSEWKLH